MNSIETIFFYVVGVAAGVVGILGLMGNGLSLAVLMKPEIRGSNSTLYLLILSVYDMSYLFLNFLLTSLDWFVYGIDAAPRFTLQFTAPASMILDPIITMTVTGSVYTTVALTIDRSIAVMKPLKWASICTRPRVKGTLLLIFLWSLISSGPLFAEIRLKKIFFHGLNESFLLPVQSRYGSSGFHEEVYLSYFIPLTTFLIPSLAIFIPNVAILISLRRMRKTNMARAQSSRQTESSRLTAQVLFISFFTLLSRLLHGSSYLIMKLEDTPFVTKCSLFCATTAAVNAFILTLNPAVNFVCYCVFGVKFRKVLFDMISAPWCYKSKTRRSKK